MLFKNFIHAVAPHLIYNILLVPLWYFILEAGSKNEIHWIVWLVLLFAFFLLLSPIILYIHYYFNDKNVLVDFDNKRREFVFIQNGKKKVIGFDQILYLDEVCYQGYYFHFLKPYYYRIISKEKEVFFFSRLRISRLAKKVDFYVNKEEVRFPIMRKGF